MDYTLLNQVLTPERVLYIWESEKADQDRRDILIRATHINDQIEAILENPDNLPI